MGRSTNSRCKGIRRECGIQDERLGLTAKQVRPDDGWLDVFISEYGRVRLFINNGNGTFSDQTKEAGLDNPLWATSASFQENSAE